MARPSSEAGTVQTPLIRYATEVGWTYVSRRDAVSMRRGETGVVFHDVLVEQLQKLNSGVVDLDRANEIAGRLTRVRPTIEGNLDAWEFLRGLKTVFIAEEKRERNVRLLDTETRKATSFTSPTN